MILVSGKFHTYSSQLLLQNLISCLFPKKRCSPFASQPDLKFWRGITFVHAESRVSSIISNKMEIATSKSVLENIIIENAGRSSDGQLVAGLLVNGGVPPYMSNMTVKNSASTGLNITDPSNGDRKST